MEGATGHHGGFSAHRSVRILVEFAVAEWKVRLGTMAGFLRTAVCEFSLGLLSGKCRWAPRQWAQPFPLDILSQRVLLVVKPIGPWRAYGVCFDRVDETP